MYCIHRETGTTLVDCFFKTPVQLDQRGVGPAAGLEPDVDVSWGMEGASLQKAEPYGGEVVLGRSEQRANEFQGTGYDVRVQTGNMQTKL